MIDFSPKLMKLRQEALTQVRSQFALIEDIAETNTARVLQAFRNCQVSDYHFRTSSGYGYGDSGRDKLDEVWAQLFGAEKALVRSQFASGTHALATALFGVLRPGDELLSVTGEPYDTMQAVIGHKAESLGSLTQWGVKYREVTMKLDGLQYDSIRAALCHKPRAVLIQRSRGYSMMRPTLTIQDISRLCAFIKEIHPACICFVDNCYGEFTDIIEPTMVGADLIAGSLIKNPGGGLAPAGGYITGKAELVELASYRLTAPGIGSHVGATLFDNRILYQGLFLAPHVVSQALKGAIFAASLFSLMGYRTTPGCTEQRSDIIQAVELKTPEKMVAFCQGLQSFSPVDAFVRPEPGPMPGYVDDVIMAGGTFVQGATMELSADGPIRSPYCIYLQGGLTFEHAILGIMGAAKAIYDN